jgi:hypothetical protein
LIVDHVIVLVADLARSEDALSACGFTLGRAGAHPTLGTHNRLVLFAHGPYLELLSVAEPLPANALHRRLLAARGTLLGLALAASVDRPIQPALAAVGVASRQQMIERPLPDATHARFVLTLPEVDGTLVFYCAHLTPERVWEPAPVHAAGLRGMDALALPPTLHPLLDWPSVEAPPAGTRAAPVRLERACDAGGAIGFGDQRWLDIAAL